MAGSLTLPLTIGAGLAGAIVVAIMVVPALQHPVISAADFKIERIEKSTNSKVVLDQGKVLKSSRFDYAAEGLGMYRLVFDNGFSSVTKTVSIEYAVGESSNKLTFSVPAGGTRSIEFNAAVDQTISGLFTVVGGTSEVKFYIEHPICIQSVFFSFNLANTGIVDGTATVKLEEEGEQMWSKDYSVKAGEHVRKNEATTVNDCHDHSYSLNVLE